LKRQGIYTIITSMEERIGSVIKFFEKNHVAAVKIDFGELSVGDTIHVKGHTSDFIQMVDSLQIEHDSVAEAKKGTSVGIKLKEHGREHDEVYKVVED